MTTQARWFAYGIIIGAGALGLSWALNVRECEKFHNSDGVGIGAPVGVSWKQVNDKAFRANEFKEVPLLGGESSILSNSYYDRPVIENPKRC